MSDFLHKKKFTQMLDEMNFKDYNQELPERDRIKEAIQDEDYDDQQ